MNKIILNFIWKGKKSRNNSDNFLKRRIKLRRKLSPHFKSHYPKCVGWQRKKLGDQWDGIASPDRDPKIHSMREGVFVCLFETGSWLAWYSPCRLG